MEEIARRMAEKIEADLYAAICGPQRKQPQTVLRVRGRSFETVELDDAGNMIEPVRCTCGHYAIIHHPRCPFWATIT